MGIRVGPPPIDEESRHRVIVPIPPMQIRNILTSGMTTRCVGGVPPDAKFITVQYDVHTMCLLAVFEHPSFDRVADGCQLPYVWADLQFDPTEEEMYGDDR